MTEQELQSRIRASRNQPPLDYYEDWPDAPSPDEPHFPDIKPRFTRRDRALLAGAYALSASISIAVLIWIIRHG